MATIEDILAKSRTRKSKQQFQPERKRPWDYAATQEGNAKKREEQEFEDSVSTTQHASKGNETHHRNESTRDEAAFGGIHFLHTDNLTALDSVKEKIMALYGVQKTLFFAITDLCESIEEEQAVFVDAQILSQLTGVNQKSIKTALYRLIQKGLLSKIDGKRARGGGFRIVLPSLSKTAANGTTDIPKPWKKSI